MRSRLHRFWFVRWFIGGSWARINGMWFRALEGQEIIDLPAMAGFLDWPGHGVHFSYIGIERREYHYPRWRIPRPR